MTKYLDIDDQRVGAVADALANPRRRAAITRLCRGPATTSELAEVVGTALPTMHQHLDTMRAAGLLSSVKRGRTVTHTLEVEPLGHLEGWIASRRQFWVGQLDALADALEADDGR